MIVVFGEMWSGLIEGPFMIVTLLYPLLVYVASDSVSAQQCPCYPLCTATKTSLSLSNFFSIDIGGAERKTSDTDVTHSPTRKKIARRPWLPAMRSAHVFNNAVSDNKQLQRCGRESSYFWQTSLSSGRCPRKLVHGRLAVAISINLTRCDGYHQWYSTKELAPQSWLVHRFIVYQRV